jgi:hypothetical protein
MPMTTAAPPDGRCRQQGAPLDQPSAVTMLLPLASSPQPPGDAMTEQPPPPVQNPLTVVMKAKSPEDYVALRRTVEHLQSLPPDQNPITVALNKIGTVHFARFAFLNNDQLAVITTYDGDFAVYINEFINEIGDVFNALMAHVESAPPLPVQTYREEFLDYIRAHDFRCVGRFYSAYPDRTVLDMLDPASASR